MSNLYRYLLPKTGGGWLRRYYQHKKLIVSMEFQSSDAVPMLPIPIFDFTREIDVADASIISNTTVDGWTVSDDGVINGSSTSHAVLIRTTQCWQNHLRSTNSRIKHSSTGGTVGPTLQQQQNSSTEAIQPQQQQQQQQHLLKQQDSVEGNFFDDDDDDDAVQLLSRPFIRWYGNLNTKIGLESKVQRSGFCAIRSPVFPFEGASLQGLYSFLEITCRYIPVVPAKRNQQSPSTQTESDTINNNPTSTETNKIHNSDSQGRQKESKPTRIFTMNLRVTSALNDDIYQGHLSLDHPTVSNSTTPENEKYIDSYDDDISTQHQPLPPFRTFVIPFDELLLTARGREREFQRRLMGSVDIESIGFLLMDNIEGPFQLDIATIRAVNCLEDNSSRRSAVYESSSQIARVSTETTPSAVETSPSVSDNEEGESPEDKQQPLKVKEPGIVVP